MEHMLWIHDIVESTWALPTLTNIGLNMANFVNFQMVVALSSIASERNKGELLGGEKSWKVTLNININHFFIGISNQPQALYALGNLFFLNV